MANRFKLTGFSKFLIILVVAAIVGVGAWFVKTKVVDPKMANKQQETQVANATETKPEQETITTDVGVTPTSEDNEINISLDEWTGWKSLIDANGGATTQPGSIYDQLGLKVNIHIMNDATQSSNALISGDLDAAGYTINRLAFLGDKFETVGVDVIMPYITNYSNGGDGIIAKTNINGVKDLVDAKIGVPQFSEAHTLVVWFVENSDLTREEKDKIEKNLVLMGDCTETANAFFAGNIDAAATWQPYLTQAASMTDSHILFDTTASSLLVMDGIVFRKDWAEAHPDLVQKFIKGSLMAADMYDTSFDAIRNTMPMYAGTDDETIKGDTVNAKLANYADNVKLLNDGARSIYVDMCEVWSVLGESADASRVNAIFDDSYVKALSKDFETTTVATKKEVKVTEEKKAEIVEAEDEFDYSLIEKSATVNFIINTAKFADTAEATTALNEFIKIAKTLDGTIIKIEGNTDPNPDSDPEDLANKLLSEQRAEAVKQYFIMNDVDANRIITVGNGSSKPMYPNDTDEHRALNRRTDVSFYTVE